jgi:hypothetical protein
MVVLLLIKQSVVILNMALWINYSTARFFLHTQTTEIAYKPSNMIMHKEMMAMQIHSLQG